jgi:hypothetical protein
MSMFEPIIDAGIRLYDAGVTAGPALPSPDSNPQDFFGRAFAAFNDKNWRYLAALCVIGAVFIVRRLLWNKIVALQNGKWAWTLAVAGASLTALTAHLASEQPVGGIVGIGSALLSGAFVGAAGAGVVKGAFEWMGKPTPPATPAPTPTFSTDLPIVPPPDDYTRMHEPEKPVAPVSPKAGGTPPRLPPTKKF